MSYEELELLYSKNIWHLLTASSRCNCDICKRESEANQD